MSNNRDDQIIFIRILWLDALISGEVAHSIKHLDLLLLRLNNRLPASPRVTENVENE